MGCIGFHEHTWLGITSYNGYMTRSYIRALIWALGRESGVRLWSQITDYKSTEGDYGLAMRTTASLQTNLQQSMQMCLRTDISLITEVHGVGEIFTTQNYL